MRNTREIVQELAAEQAGKRFKTVALVVGFDQSTEFVFEADQNGLVRLEGLMAEGGHPIGMVGLVTEGVWPGIYARPLAEHAQEDWVDGYLNKICDIFARVARAQGLLAQDFAARQPGWPG